MNNIIFGTGSHCLEAVFNLLLATHILAVRSWSSSTLGLLYNRLFLSVYITMYVVKGSIHEKLNMVMGMVMIWQRKNFTVAGNLEYKEKDRINSVHIVGGRLNQTRLEINDRDHFFSKYISTFL